jgi:hypothetical protein
MTAADTREPNFFIVGAPKCGTSALAGYLREHPDCFMCWPKEPLFFCEDLSGIRQVESLPEYLHLFADAPPGVRAVGEASAMYFYSQVAIARVRECFASARLIVMLRSPIDLVEAFHAQLQYPRCRRAVQSRNCFNIGGLLCSETSCGAYSQRFPQRRFTSSSSMIWPGIHASNICECSRFSGFATTGEWIFPQSMRGGLIG